MLSLSSIIALLAAIGGAAISIFFSRPYFKRKGAQEAEKKAKEADHDKAEKLRERLNRREPIPDPDQWLRENGWLPDDK